MAGNRTRVTLAAIALVAACRADPPPAKPATEPDPLVPLRAFEREKRAHATFVEAPTSDRTFGADPYDLVALPDGTFAGILRGRDAVVLLDASLAETARIPVARAPSAIAVYDGPPRASLRPGDLLVTSELAPVIAHVRGRERLADIPLAGVSAARAIAVAPDGTIRVSEEHDGTLVSIGLRAGGAPERKTIALPVGPMRMARTRRGVVVASVGGHTVTAIDDDGTRASASIDGPFWAIAARDVDGGTIIVASGTEDHALDRREGFFGYIDSFVYVWFRPDGSNELVRVARIDASEHDVVVPKAIAFTNATHATVAAYGSAHLLHLAFTHGPSAPPETSTSNAIPGTSALVATPHGLVSANPLADAWIAYDGTGAHASYPNDDTPTPPRVRLGEALFFTELMAPSNKTDGALSRFTCETCHFEGYVDGRTHHTGRADVHATTKPLVGLFNNKPHFSRALDPDLSAVAENEFRVAGAHSGTDPHFAVDVADGRFAWLSTLRIEQKTYSPTELRIALIDFLMAFSHRPNPGALAARTFSPTQRAGADAFRARCEGCHEARTIADDASTRAAFDRWEGLLLDGHGSIVWARDTYEKTGVTPYVHENGTRVPSLRRLYKKRPYFTNGSAHDVKDVLARVRILPSGALLHDGAVGAPLAADEMEGLAAFLDLL